MAITEAVIKAALLRNAMYQGIVMILKTVAAIIVNGKQWLNRMSAV